MRPARYLSVTLIAIAALSMAACGSSNKTTSSPAPAPATPTTSTPTTAAGGSGSSAVTIDADASGALKFSVSQASAKAGSVTLTMHNPSQVMHGIAVTGNGVNQTGQIVGQGAVSTVKANLKPGTYTFFCPVPGHRQAGMQGTLTVR